MASIFEEAIEELRLRKLSPGLFIPKYDGFSLPNLSNSLAKFMGAKVKGRFLKEDVFSEFKGVDRIILIIIDAMGFNVFVKSSEALRGFLEKLFLKNGSCFRVLTSVFPSTTSTALTSFNTGLTPQEHGIVAYVLFMKELSSMVNMISLSPVNDERRNRIFELGMSPERLLGVKVLTQRLRESGLRSKTLIRYGIRNSGLSTILYRDSEIVPALTTVDFATNLARLMKDGKTDFVMAYWDGFDAQSHHYGPFSQEAELELLNTFTLLKTAINQVPLKIADRTLLLITSDHGQSRVSDDKAIKLEDLKQITKHLVMPPAGESRAAYFYVKDESEGFKNIFRKAIREIVLFESLELFKKGVFGLGEANPCVSDRVGDYVALSKGEERLIFHYDLKERTEPEFVKAGAHGSLTLDELLIPLVACKASILQR
ncbi:MAG: alkaline phosphatase family protein [Thermoproteota archaeon]|nr:alkaline phosphatase family protein [Candidatus Brockarchaeota archaeon]